MMTLRWWSDGNGDDDDDDDYDDFDDDLDDDGDDDETAMIQTNISRSIQRYSNIFKYN